MNEVIWVEKYRPKTVDECILPDSIKSRFSAFVKNREIPNLLLSGKPGMGKTTVALAMLNELDCDSMVINASMNGGIDTLRTDITQFASTVSFLGGRKYVILDEADHLTNATQASLRNFMESFSSNCGFILTCNFSNKIIEPLHSRCNVIEFRVDKNEKQQMMAQFFKRVKTILEKEGITYDQAAVVNIIQKQFPDFRKTLNTLQSYGSTGNIDLQIISALNKSVVADLFSILKTKDFDKMRKWVGENQDQDVVTLYRQIFDQAKNYVTAGSLPGVIVTLGEYMYKHNFVADPEINMVAFLTVIMHEATFL